MPAAAERRDHRCIEPWTTSTGNEIVPVEKRADTGDQRPMIERLLIEIECGLWKPAVARQIGVGRSCLGDAAGGKDRVQLEKAAAVIVADLRHAAIRLGHREAEFGGEGKAGKMPRVERAGRAGQSSYRAGTQRRRIRFVQRRLLLVGKPDDE